MVDVYFKDPFGNILFKKQVIGYDKQQHQIIINEDHVMTITLTFQKIKETTITPVSEKEQIIFNKLATHIQLNLSENLSIQQLATLAGMNRTKLQASFKLIFGKTINGFTKDLKMQTAKELLLSNSAFSLKEIAAMIGYKHTNHFSAAFKKYFDCAPSALKAKIANSIQQHM